MLSAEDRSLQNRGLGPRFLPRTPQTAPRGVRSADLVPVPQRR